MSTTSKVTIPQLSTQISQGDIYKNVKYNYIDVEDNTSVDIIEYEFPLAIIISQACDVIAMDEMIAKSGGKSAKFMPSILMCPIYEKNAAKSGEHISEVLNGLSLKRIDEAVYQRDDYKVAERDWHYRFHALELALDDNKVLRNALIDYKHYFTVPISYLSKHRENRIYHMDDLFAEQITLKFATYLSRVAIP